MTGRSSNINIDSLKYYELQRLAKCVGIKANQKIEKLVNTLRQHYSKVQTEDDSSTYSHQKKHKSSSVKEIQNPTPVELRHKLSPIQKNKSAPDVGTSSLAINGSASNKAGRKRRRIFDLDKPTLSAACTPTSDGTETDTRVTRLRSSNSHTPSGDKITDVHSPSKKRIRSTFEKNDKAGAESMSIVSPGTKAVISLVDGCASNTELKVSIMSAIDKKVQEKLSCQEINNGEQPSQIPRFMEFLANKKKTDTQIRLTPGNKDWKKIHNKGFSKFDSIDVYLEKKQKRMDKLTNSAKKGIAQFSLKKGPAIAKPVTKPSVQVKPFVPSVTSTKNLNFNFIRVPTGATSTARTPSRPVFVKKPAAAAIKEAVAKTPKILAPSSARSVKRGTPFHFTGNTSSLNVIQTSHKKSYDLKASLSRPLSWKPHTGKLQPLDTNKSIAVKLRSGVRPSRQTRANKARPENAKDVRRVKELDRRNNQKYIDMMTRRGLML